MSSSFVTAFLSFALILVIGCTFLAFYFRSVREEIKISWSVINEKTRRRLDKLPLLIELFWRTRTRDSADPSSEIKLKEGLFQEIIISHEQIWPLEELSPVKVQRELALTAQLHELWNTTEKDPAFKNDVNFLALRKEITDLGEEIDRLGEAYNQKIYRYNRLIRFPIWRPLGLIFGFQRLPIFEFEV